MIQGINGAMGGAAGGFAGGFTGGYIMSGFDVNAGWDAAVSGLKTGVAMGGALGAAEGYIYAKQNYINPFSGKTVYPSNDGFTPGTEDWTQAEVGECLIHYGKPDDSYYLAPDGTASQSLSLPFNNNLELHRYEVMSPFNLKGGIASPWFNQPGGGIQFKSSYKIGYLTDPRNGYLRPIP